MRINKQIEMKGTYVKQDNKFIFKDDKIICNRKGSIVEVKENEIIIIADVTGVDKVYFEIKNNKVMISDRFKDFLDNNVNSEFLQFQIKNGYVPYPFTLLKNVRKSPPGIKTRIKIHRNKINQSYEASDELKIFCENKKLNKNDFREEFENLLRMNFTQKGMISSFSGGFDSLLLTEFYKAKCRYILHFHENSKVQIKYYTNRWPIKKWLITKENQKFNEKDRKRYFNAIDEPCCDSAGFAEYLMVKNVFENKKIRRLPIMNGQGADGLFCSGRIYFQDSVSRSLKYPAKNFKLQYGKSFLNTKIFDYGTDTKSRFIRFYLQGYEFNNKIMSEFDNIYYIYNSAIKNDSTNLLAALIFLLRYSIHGVEKIKTAARTFNAYYYLPFMSTNVIRLAFSIPSKYKTGYKSGKKILIEKYPEFNKITYVSGPFIPNKLKESFIEGNAKEGYNEYFTKKWTKYNLRRQII